MNKSKGLILKNIKKTFRHGDDTLRILEDINLHVNPGEIVAITGESGVGKTTLLHIIGSIETPDSGEILLDDQLVSSLGERDTDVYRNRHVSFVFQFFHLLPEFNATENVAIPLLVRGEQKKNAFNRALLYLDKIGLGNRADHLPVHLSGGEQQRVAFARALITGPKLLLADEPTGNLDPRTGNEVFKAMYELHKQTGNIALVATHNPEIAKKCDKIYNLEKGYLRKR